MALRCSAVPADDQPRGADGHVSLPGRTPWPEPPTVLGDVCLVPLARNLVRLDTAAYRASPRAISAHSAGRWPLGGFTLEADLPLLARHEDEHRAGNAFAYALLGPRGDEEWGCVYLRPLAAYVHHTPTRPPLPEATIRLAAIATFWLIDDDSRRAPVTEVVRIIEAWTEAWGAAPIVFRCLPEERGSVSALDGSGMDRVEASAQPLPYVWFFRARRPSVAGEGEAWAVGRSGARAHHHRRVDAEIGEHRTGGVAAGAPGHRAAGVRGRARLVQPGNRQPVRRPAHEDLAGGQPELPTVAGAPDVVPVARLEVHRRLPAHREHVLGTQPGPRSCRPLDD